ncbi:MAG: hypothetical protein ACRECW_15930 [Phyllobacterium sp.]
MTSYRFVIFDQKSTKEVKIKQQLKLPYQDIFQKNYSNAESFQKYPTDRTASLWLLLRPLCGFFLPSLLRLPTFSLKGVPG